MKQEPPIDNRDFSNAHWKEGKLHFASEVVDPHYNNSKGSLYLFAQNQELNAWEFDIIKRITRCRKKGQFKEDLEKTKRVIDLYLQEYESPVHSDDSHNG